MAGALTADHADDAVRKAVNLSDLWNLRNLRLGAIAAAG